MLISFPSSPGCEGSREGACGWSHWLIGSIGLFSIYFMTQTKFKGSCDAHRPWRSPHGMKKYCGKSISNHHVLSPPEDQDPPSLESISAQWCVCSQEGCQFTMTGKRQARKEPNDHKPWDCEVLSVSLTLLPPDVLPSAMLSCREFVSSLIFVLNSFWVSFCE